MHPTGNIRLEARRRLGIALVLTAILFAGEFAGGLWANSLALLSDAGHMLGDLVALTLSYLAVRWATKPPTSSKTYGYYRLEVLVTFINGGLLLYVAFQILWEAGRRLFSPEAVDLGIMIPFAALGLLVNLVCAILLRHQRKNMVARSAFYHVISDLISSLGVLGAALVIALTGWKYADTCAAVFIAVLIVAGALRLLRQAYDVLMEGSPEGLDLTEIRGVLSGVAGVKDVRDLHVWTIGSGLHAASAHIFVRNMDIRESERIIHEAADLLKERYSIDHTTLQVLPFRNLP